MNILALEPYFGGSHASFLKGWMAESSHDWTLLSLPAYKWKWRMRHSSVTLARETATLVEKGRTFDRVFCSDMLNLAEFKGLVPRAVRDLPTVIYFHENQLTYPVRKEDERDYHYVLSNMIAALCASAVWFNSGFHLNSFLSALPDFLQKMPDYNTPEPVDQIREKSAVQYPGIRVQPHAPLLSRGPVRILWAARWEHDKNPEDFFQALKRLKKKTVDFRLSVIGERFRDCPEVFTWAKEYFSEHIDHWGFIKDRSTYQQILSQADIMVSTANHEFFGISVMEAAAAGAVPLLPRRLSYPELFSEDEAFFYDGSVRGLAAQLEQICTHNEYGRRSASAAQAAKRFEWPVRAREMDQALPG
mgnify:CR=1 FL=1